MWPLALDKGAEASFFRLGQCPLPALAGHPGCLCRGGAGPGLPGVSLAPHSSQGPPGVGTRVGRGFPSRKRHPVPRSPARPGLCQRLARCTPATAASLGLGELAEVGAGRGAHLPSRPPLSPALDFNHLEVAASAVSHHPPSPNEGPALPAPSPLPTWEKNVFPLPLMSFTSSSHFLPGHF